MPDTAIEWTDKTWNPTVGCSKVGGDPACENCYAVPQALRIQRMGGRGGRAYEGTTTLTPDAVLDWSGQVNLLHERLDLPDWGTPKLVFVDSMSDLFHGSVPTDFIAEVFKTMAHRPRHIFQILTKRVSRMMAVLQDVEFIDKVAAPVWPLPNVWIGTSIGSPRFVYRADYLRKIDWPTRFLSLEPLIAPLPPLNTSGIHWVIVGGESISGGGPAALAKIRAMHPDWVRQIRDDIDTHNNEWAYAQCPYYRRSQGVPLDAPGMEGAYGPGTCSMGCRTGPVCVTGSASCDAPDAPVAFMFKQWGNWEPLDNLQDWLDSGGSSSEPGILILNRNGSNTRGTAVGSLSNHLGYFTGDENDPDSEWVFKWRAHKHRGRDLDGTVWGDYPPQFYDHMEIHR